MQGRAIIPHITAGMLSLVMLAAPQALADRHQAEHADDDPAASRVEQAGDLAQAAVRDAWLDGRLETALLFNEQLNSFLIDTDVRDGVAYLDGTVGSEIDRDLAGDIAGSIEGISEVENALVVDVSAATPQDDDDVVERQGFLNAVENATLTAKIKSKLLADSSTAGLAIDVDSNSGQVILSGTVDSPEEKQLAERIAASTDGARTVINHLTVASESR